VLECKICEKVACAVDKFLKRKKCEVTYMTAMMIQNVKPTMIISKETTIWCCQFSTIKHYSVWFIFRFALSFCAGWAEKNDAIGVRKNKNHKWGLPVQTPWEILV